MSETFNYSRGLPCGFIIWCICWNWRVFNGISAGIIYLTVWFRRRNAIGYVNVIADTYNNNSMACLRNTVFFKFIEMWSNCISSIAEFC